MSEQPTCAISNCRNHAPAHDPFCTAHRDADRDHQLRATIRDLEADLSALKQRVAEVLEPFAEVADKYADDWSDWSDAEKIDSDLTAGHFRRAAELHASLRSSEGHPTDEGRRASSETLAEPDEAALERAGRAFLEEYDTYRPGRPEAGRQREAMRAALSSLTVTESGE